ncbi:helix-turn-helix domain-containing protein [Enterococcus casseliflavus]|uniref:helix-turn-helix domain-containing protein n=1 Tax=Enterococcus casseliflavus TaxID=37734 RepID=UPI00398F9138
MKTIQTHFVTNAATLRWLRILAAFEENPVCSTKSLAHVSNSTSRTIVTDINDLKAHFDDAVSIESSHRGYVFDILHPQQYLTAKRALIADELLFHIIESIFQNELRSSLEWAEAYHISESTVLRYLKKIHPVLRMYQLKMQYSPVSLVGKESHIRKFFHDFYYESEITAHTIFPPIAVHDVTLTLFADCQQYLNQSCSFGEFNYYLYITLERFCGGHQVEQAPKLAALVTKQSDFIAFAQINQIIDQHYQEVLPEDELVHLFVLVFGRRSINDLRGEKNFCRKYNQYPKIKPLVHDLVETFLTDTRNAGRERILLESFFTVIYMKQLMTPLLNHNTPEVNTFLKESFPDEWRRVQAFFRAKSEYAYMWDAKSLTHIMSSLILYACSIQSLHWQSHKNVVFLFEGSHFVYQFLKSSATRYIRRSRHFFFPDSNELSPEYFQRNQIDLIVTNYAEYAAEYGSIECLLFRPYPDKQDWESLEQKLDPLLAEPS